MEKTQSITVTKRSFIASYRNKLDCGIRDAEKAYDAFIETITEELIAGNSVKLSGLGVISFKLHKGHRIHFSDSTSIGDYIKLKFTASDIINREIKANEQGIIEKITPNDNEQHKKE